MTERSNDNYNFNPSQSADSRPNGDVNMDTLKRDRFELLSAYLDGEVTAAERAQVEQWLATDTNVQRLYDRLLDLRHGFQNLPVPPPQQAADELAEQVFARADRRPKRLIWGGAAVAALILAALAGVVGGNRSFAPQMAREAEFEGVAQPLRVSLNEPVVESSPTPVPSPDNSLISRALFVE